MKKLLYIGLCLIFAACTETPEQKLGKKIIGEWCNPYTYQSTGELKGFNFKKGGVCEAINIPSLELKSWEIEEGEFLVIKGMDVAKDGTKAPYETREKIGTLNQDTLYLITKEEHPRIAFLYLNTKIIKDKVELQQEEVVEEVAEVTTDTTQTEQ